MLVTPCSNDDFTISVVQGARARNDNSGIVEINQVTITLPSVSIVFQAKDSVKINNMPLAKSDGNMMTVGEVLVQWIGSNVYATFEDTGINVFWDGLNSIHVSVSNSLREELCGLCGFYNGKSNDDLRKRDGSTASNSDDFAVSWRQGRGNNCQPKDLERTCGPKPLRWSNQTCDVFRSAPFTSCHSKIDPEPYIANCVRDFCDCSRSIRARRDACACKVIASYARACAQAGVNMTNWISRTRCSEFNSTLHVNVRTTSAVELYVDFCSVSILLNSINTVFVCIYVCLHVSCSIVM